MNNRILCEIKEILAASRESANIGMLNQKQAEEWAVDQIKNLLHDPEEYFRTQEFLASLLR